MDFWVDGFKSNNKKKLEKLNKINIHQQALFAAVEHGHVEKARTILESTDADVNSVNSDALTPLDVAVLTNHRSLAKMLITFGAQEGNRFCNPDKLFLHMKQLLVSAERKLQELNGEVNTPEHEIQQITSCHGSGAVDDKEILLWERRYKGLKKMILGFDQARPPDEPSLVAVDVTGNDSVTVSIQEPEHQDSAICTKFKVEWSSSESFDAVDGVKEISDTKSRECCIEGLVSGRRYWFRAACGNLKGYGRHRASTPSSVLPSSWRDVQGQEPRFAGRMQQLDELFTEIRNLRPDNASELKDFPDQDKQGETPALQRRNPKKKTTIKQLFTVSGKFQKNLKRGVFLACLLYHDDKVLVTNEDFLPVIEVDETHPNSIYNDFHWFMKVACTWDDVKLLKQDMERNLSSTTSLFRIKLLQAAQQMQSSLNMQDLGQLYYKPIRDSQGTLVFCNINYISNPKSVSVLNLRWVPLSKVQKKLTTQEIPTVSELLMASIQTQMTYHQVSNIKLSKGLYLGYLKMRSSVDLIQVIVPTKTPNVLPHCKIRDNPHVSSEEWEWLTRFSTRHKSLENIQQQGLCKDEKDEELQNKPTEQQQTFIEQVATTARRLFSQMELRMENAMAHRLYDVEVVELSPEISFLVIVPPAETSCSVPGQKESLLQRGEFIALPVQVFEMIHLTTYQHDVISRYSRLSCILELGIVLAQQCHREAFSSSEVQVTKNRLSKLQDLKTQLNRVWKGARWVMDVLTFARDRGTYGSSNLSLTTSSALNLLKAQTTQANSMSSGISTCGFNNMPGISIKHLLSLTKKKDVSRKSPSRTIKNKSVKDSYPRALLQIPTTTATTTTDKSKMNKSSGGGGRGSWPGPGVDNVISLLETSFSKSEQQLNVIGHDNFQSDYHRKYSEDASDGSTSSRYVTVNSASSSSRTSRSQGHDKTAAKTNNRLPPSRSEDHLLLQQGSSSTHHQHHQHQQPHYTRSRSSTINNNTGGSVSATNSPIFPTKNLSDSLTDSLHSLSSDESTAAVVSLPVTTPRVLHHSSADAILKKRQAPPSILSGTTIPVDLQLNNDRKQIISSSLPSGISSLLTGSVNQFTAPLDLLYHPGVNLDSPSSTSNNTDTTTSTTSTSTNIDQDNDENKQVTNDLPTPSSGVLQVYAAYETGLASGTSLKLHVTPRTSAREVVDLVVKQLNMAVILKGKDGPIYSQDKLKNFCLVAVIGARERCLRDDFKPLQLQNPWKKGRLYVRQKQDVLAALEHSARQTSYL